MTGKIATIERYHADTLPASTFGGKAAELALSAAEGFPVPPGFVLSTDVFPGKEWIATQRSRVPDERSEAVYKQLQTHGLDISRMLEELGGLEFAVRSSATCEDSKAASFAGSFATVLSVEPRSIYTAIYDVWASTFTDRVRRYLTDRDLADRWDDLKMAVLVQPMIRPLLSGVGLSHPLGEPTQPWISVGIVRGFGDRLVGGEVNPQTYLLERGTWSIVQHRNAADIDVVYELASAIGRTIDELELRRGCAQDIEFVITPDLDFSLLQNRPIAGRSPGNMNA